LRGWRRHDELWNAYRNPGQDYGELIESIRLHIELHGNLVNEDIKYLVNPLGHDWRIPSSLMLWDASMKRYRKSQAFKSYIRESGVHEYWQKVGFPPQCRAIGQDNFECD